VDHLYRLMVRAFASGVGRKLGYLAVVALLGVFSHCAHAEGTVDPSGTSQYKVDVFTYSTGWVGDPGTACALAAQAPTWCTSSYKNCGVDSYTSQVCNAHRALVSNSQVYHDGSFSIQSRPGNSCPSNATLSADGNTCTCDTNFAPSADHKACVAVPPKKCSDVASGMSGTYYAAGAKSAGYHLCVQGCDILADVAGFDSNGAYFAGPFRSTGGTCTGAGTGTNNNDPPKPDPNPLPNPPKPGYCPGSVNNVPVPGGVPCSGGTASPGATPAPTPDPPAPGASGVASAGTDPGSSTVCKSGTCTTTSGQGNGTGGGGGAVCQKAEGCTYTQSKDEFCAANPGSGQCKDDDSSFGGSCSGGFTCSGDAVECAIAQETYRRNCQTLEPAGAGDPAVQAAAAGDQPSWHPAKNGQSVNLGSGFDQTNIVSGSCPADQTIQVSHFTPVVIAFSKLCQPAEWLGNILVGLAALACLGIVFVRGS
jgi:hypothetical protein